MSMNKVSVIATRGLDPRGSNLVPGAHSCRDCFVATLLAMTAIAGGGNHGAGGATYAETGGKGGADHRRGGRTGDGGCRAVRQGRGRGGVDRCRRGGGRGAGET